MFIGHYAVALAAKPAAKETSLGLLVAAAVGLDLLWPMFVFVGLETFRVSPGSTAVMPVEFLHMPYSHSLMAAFGWAVLAALAKGKKDALVVGGLVFSHWLLDAASHRPDMPLTFSANSAKVGLGLWQSVPWTLFVEGTMLAAGGWLAVKGGVPLKRLAWFVGFLAVMELGVVFGPPPPNEFATAASGLGQWLFVWWAARIDRAA